SPTLTRKVAQLWVSVLLPFSVSLVTLLPLRSLEKPSPGCLPFPVSPPSSLGAPSVSPTFVSVALGNFKATPSMSLPLLLRPVSSVLGLVSSSTASSWLPNSGLLFGQLVESQMLRDSSRFTSLSQFFWSPTSH